MKLGKLTCWTILCGLPLVFAGCNGGVIDPNGSIQSGVQDLTMDPTGLTTVVTFSAAPGSGSASNFTASDGQTAANVAFDGTTATITWSDRVTPSHTITVTDLPGVTNGFIAVTTTDDSVPTFTITDSAMVAGLGGDTLEVTFDGPRVVESAAEAPTTWTLQVDSTPLDLTGSTFVLDNDTQVLEITLGANANLHSSFTLAASSLTSVADVPLATTAIAGTASGDSTAPTLSSVVQNLTEDEFGRVVDFTFDEAMDPVFSEVVTNFGVPTPNIATTVDQPSAGLLRVTFASPVVPGVHEVTLSDMMDVHGNAGPSGAQAVTQPSPVANAFDTIVATTVVNSGGDFVQATFVQGFLESSAEDIANWTLVVDGNTIDLAAQTVTYTLATKTYRVDLAFDMTNGTAYSLTASGVIDVDGQAFGLGDSGTVAGDSTAPTATTVVQNRTQDPTGQTLDVTFSEDLDATEAETTSNWAVSGLTVANATLLGTPNVVRLTLTGGPAVPGTATLDVDGIEDLAGNPMAAPQNGMAITSTDTTAPSITAATATAFTGANNDVVIVWFDDDMVASGVENAANWTIESPIGTGLTEAGASITYSSTQRNARLTFDASNGMFFKAGNDFLVSLATMTDIAGNAVSTNPLTDRVDAELVRPWADAAWADGTINTDVVVRFSEHMDYLDDLYDAVTNVDGTRFVIRDNVGVLRGLPASASVLNNGLGVRLTYGFVINATDTIDVIGATDLAGNYMFPTLAMPLLVEDADDPEISLPVNPLVAISGERNDTITITFDRNVSPWGPTSPNNYIIETGGNALDLGAADFAFDGDATVVITLDGSSSPSLQAASSYDFSIDNLQSDQGVTMTAVKTSLGVAVFGDTTGPTVGAADVKLDASNPNALLVSADEALDQTNSEDVGRWDYNTGTAPTLAELIDPTTVRLTFAAPPVAGNTLDYNVVDLAGNPGGSASKTIQAADSAAPLLVSVSGTAVAGVGGDYLTVVYDEPVDQSTGLTDTNYTVTNGATSIDLSSSAVWYDSITYSVKFLLAPGVEFDASQGINVTVASVADHGGNVMASPVALGGVVVGDTTTPPGVLSAFVNYRENLNGYQVDVWFDEAPDETFTSDPLNWDVTGGSSEVVMAVEMIAEDHYRVTLSGALGTGEELEIATGLPDLAGNATVSATSVTVIE